MRSAARALSSAILVAALLSACGGGGEAGDARDADFRSAMDGLCQAETYVSQQEYRAASDVFQGEAHEYLHQLAAELQEKHPAVAGSILEAKEQVETSFRDPSFYGPEEIVRRIGELRAALARGGEVLGLEGAGCAA